MPAPPTSSHIAMLFLVSGLSALIYQVVWQRTLFATFGINSESVTVLVSVFMCGLGNFDTAALIYEASRRIARAGAIGDDLPEPELARPALLPYPLGSTCSRWTGAVAHHRRQHGGGV